MNSLKSKIIASVITIAVVMPLASVVYAQPSTGLDLPGANTSITTVSSLVDIIRGVVKWIYTIFFIIAVLFIIFAAFTYLTAGGDPEKTTKAKNQLIYATVAIAVALLALGFQSIVANFLASPTS
ncbi:MAG: pilin [Spirochaetota bacterium]